MSLEVLRDAVTRLNDSAAALAVLGAALDAKTSGVALDPVIAPYVREVLEALGVRVGVEETPLPVLAKLLTEIRSFWLLNGKLLYPGGRMPGWNHTEAELLQSIGAITHNLPDRIRQVIAPKLEGLGPRLEGEGAAFLDVGVGVAWLSIEMAQAFPHLRVVGVDPWGPSIALARENVAKVGLAGRIEVRQQGGQDLADQDAFDLAWMASVFMPEKVVPAVVERVLSALRPGGWLLFAIAKPSPDPLLGALARFRMSTFGGAIWTLERAEAALREAGFTEVGALPTPPGAVAAIVVARRPPKV